jgi:Terminase small subunit
MLKNGQARLRKVRSLSGLSQMPELKNIRRERFCLLYVMLGNATEAYRQAGYRDVNHADVSGCRLLTFASVKARIDEIKALAAPKKVRNREGVLEWLDDLMSRPADEPVKWSDKLRAAEIIARMCGYNAADRVEVSAGDSLSNYIVALRARPIGGEVLKLENGSENP